MEVFSISINNKILFYYITNKVLSMKISILKKVKLFKEYKEYINSSYTLLVDNDFRISSVYRLYTIVTIPMDTIPEEYRINKKDVSRLEEGYLNDSISKHIKLFNTIGLNGLYSEPILEKVDKFTYLVYYNYKFFNNVTYQFIKYGIYSFIFMLLIILGIIFI